MAWLSPLREFAQVLTAFPPRAPPVYAEPSTDISQTSQDLVTALRAHQHWAPPIDAECPSPLPLLGLPHYAPPELLPMSPPRQPAILSVSPPPRQSPVTSVSPRSPPLPLLQPRSAAADRICATAPCRVGHDHPPSQMAALQFRTDEDPRLTATPVFRDYQWRSDAFRTDSWRLAQVDQAIMKFFQTLVRLDQDGFPRDTMNLDHATFRAHLGLPNCYSHKIDEQRGYTTKAANAFWTSLLRFQVLDLLLSEAHGVSNAPSPKEPPPPGSGSRKLLSALSNWPTRLKVLTEGTSSTAQILTKTCENFQIMGAALRWILEVHDVHPILSSAFLTNSSWTLARSKFASNFGRLLGKEKLTLNTVLRTLSYAINFSPVIAMCNINLSKPYGHVMSQYKTRAFVGRFRPPRLMHLENVIMTVIREGGDRETTRNADATKEGQASESLTSGTAIGVDCRALEQNTLTFSIRDNGDVNMSREQFKREENEVKPDGAAGNFNAPPVSISLSRLK
ncbi:hypothetical protein C8F04DRAFT_1179542 [Mycena alexandri]|uniref:Uncharacterized protein n=1 Tax=Mycena alexandri TaxID=1745969 RepID=A0AAD6T691_9AGAR|nr:hypothetical protein C8F04DRAFT_1179542 [Mycena alexandri]